MTPRPTPFTKTSARKSRNYSDSEGVSLQRLSILVEQFLLVCDIKRHSETTIASRKERLGRLQWFLKEKGFEVCDHAALLAFFHYLNHGHKTGGRWGNSTHKKTGKPLSSGRVMAFYSSIRTFFNWVVDEGEIDVSPMARIPKPVDRPDQVQPFSEQQVRDLIKAARNTRLPIRDEAILLTLIDTGIRASELCGIDVGDLDLIGCQLTIRHGKGDKARIVPFSRETKKALYNYLRQRGLGEGDENEPLFISEHGRHSGNRLVPFALIQLFRRLGHGAGISGVRCSPHTARHTFAIMFLRNGGNVFTLKTVLGHESLSMTNKYVAIAQADVQKQHAQYSPVARLMSGKVK
jgi:integrase/recombinase XerC